MGPGGGRLCTQQQISGPGGCSLLTLASPMHVQRRLDVTLAEQNRAVWPSPPPAYTLVVQKPPPALFSDRKGRQRVGVSTILTPASY